MLVIGPEVALTLSPTKFKGDPEKLAGQQAAKHHFGHSIPILVETLLRDYFPNDEARKKFGADALDEFENSPFHLYGKLSALHENVS